MSTLLLATADVPQPVPTSWVISDTVARTGSKSFYTSVGTTVAPFPVKLSSGNSNLYIRYCFRWDSTGTSYRVLWFRFEVGGSSIISLVTTADGAIQLRSGAYTGTLLHNVNDVVVSGVWVTVELHINATSCTWKLNGSQVYQNTGLTLNVTGVDMLEFSGTGGATSTRWRGYLDDIVVCTDKWPGQGGLHVFEPTGAGTTTDWSSALPTLSTPGDTADVRHQFTVADAPATAAIVHRLGVAVSAKVDGQGYGAIKPGINTDFTSDVEGLSVSPKFIQRYWPGVSLVDFNNLEIGVQSA